MKPNKYVFYLLLLLLSLNAQENDIRYKYVKTDECFIPIPIGMKEVNPGIYAVSNPVNDIERSETIFISSKTNTVRERDTMRNFIAKSKLKNIYQKYGYIAYLPPKLSPVIDIEGSIVGELHDFVATIGKTFFIGSLNQDEGYIKHLLDYCYAHRINPPPKDNANRESNNSF